MSEESKQIQAALMGSPSAFEFLIPLYGRKLFSIAFAVVQDTKDAEELVQEVFLSAFHDRLKIASAEDFPLWLVNTTRQRARDFQRKHRHETAPEPVLDTLRTLPEPEREAITLRYLDGLKPESIEPRLGLSTGSFTNILGRTLAKLRSKEEAG